MGAWVGEAWDTVRRAFEEFLALPTAVIAIFILMAWGSHQLDLARPAWLESTRAVLRSHVFADPEATSALLGTIAAGIITVTSITISLLLIAVQQTAAAMTSQVFDQFLRRKPNQIYFGFFVGLALFALIILATVNAPFNPVIGATLTLLSVIVALYLLILLFYSAIDQMRPAEIIETIHDHVLAARKRQMALVNATRRSPFPTEGTLTTVRARRHGYVTHIGAAAIESALRRSGEHAEIVLRISIGSFVAHQDAIADIRGSAPKETNRLTAVVIAAIHLERQRDIALDAAYGIEQLATIGWTSISSAKSNPAPGLMAIRSLRDLLARWSADAPAGKDGSREPCSIAYTDDVPAQVMNALESLAVASSESMQHQTCAEVLVTLAIMFGRLPSDQQERAEDLIRRTLSALGDHVLTATLDNALANLITALRASSREDTAAAVAAARHTLDRSVGEIHSRATRVR